MEKQSASWMTKKFYKGDRIFWVKKHMWGWVKKVLPGGIVKMRPDKGLRGKFFEVPAGELVLTAEILSWGFQDDEITQFVKSARFGK